MGDFQNDGAVDPAGVGDQDGLHVQDDLAECLEFVVEGFGHHEFLPLAFAQQAVEKICMRASTSLTCTS